jgi:hypothetical protein
MKMEQSIPKRRHIKFRRRGITQEKTYNECEVVYTVDKNIFQASYSSSSKMTALNAIEITWQI